MVQSVHFQTTDDGRRVIDGGRRMVIDGRPVSGRSIRLEKLWG
jgi:hypothetical protein